MGTDKRERQKANKAAKQEAERKAEARGRRIRTIRNAVLAGLAIVVVMVLISVLSGCASEPGEEADEGAATTEVAGDAAGPVGDGTCPPAEGAERTIDFTSSFAECIDPDKSYTATIETTEGTVTVALDTERTPETTNNFVALARYGYYDGTDLFRTEAGTGIIQGGSPHTQDNSDPGPGYTIDDEGLPFSSDDYGPGTLAMARTSAPNSASGQFFLLANDGGRYLGDPAQLGEAAGTYAVFGQVTEGLDVLEAIANLDDGTGRPSQPVQITSVTIAES